MTVMIVVILIAMEKFSWMTLRIALVPLLLPATTKMN